LSSYQKCIVIVIIQIIILLRNSSETMARHYYRTNVPLSAMIVWWGFLAVCIIIFAAYNAIVKEPERRAQAEAQRTWERQHFNGWKLEQKHPAQSDIEHGIFYDRMEQKSCTTKGYPGNPPCPTQLYYVNGVPGSPPVQAPVETSHKPLKKTSQP
jgi:hypothetical protein